MNLATDPWIPIVHRNGQHRLVSLCQVFAEGKDYADLAVRPHERIALMRLLIAIAQAALDGPEDIDGWDAVPELMPDVTISYLGKWCDVFEFFHPTKPFLQIGELQVCSDKPTLVSKLDFALASGQQSTLFDHAAIPGENEKYKTRYFAPEKIALMLITYLNFSTGGGLPVAQWKTVKTSQVGNPDAPCIPGSMCHAFLRGPNLNETIHLNLLTKETVIGSRYAGSWGVPVWEWMPSSPNDGKAIENATTTYLGRFAPISRWIRLLPDCIHMICGKGFDYVSQGLFEPSSTLIIREDKRQPRSTLGAKHEKALWRELPAILVKQHEQKGMGHGPLALENLGKTSDCDLFIGALIRKRGQQDIEDAVESVLFVPNKLRSIEGRGRYEDEVKFAESIERQLRSAVETWRVNVDGGWEGRLKREGPKKVELLAKFHAIATRHYWTSVEKLRHLLLAHIATLGSSSEAVQESHARWRKAIRAAAFNAYRLTCGQETPRQVRAYALGLMRLTGESASEKSETKQETMKA